MDTSVPPVPMNPAMAAEFRRLGLNPDDVEGLFWLPAAASIDIPGPLGPVMAVATDFLNNRPNEWRALFGRLFSPTDYAFPDPPVSPAARLFALPLQRAETLEGRARGRRM